MTERHGTSPEDLLSPAEASAYLAISDRTLYRYEDRGLVSPLRTPGGHRRFRRGDLDGLLTKAAS